MWTDSPPRGKALRAQFDASDQTATLALPPAELLQARSNELRDALLGGEPKPVLAVGQRLLDELAQFYKCTPPRLKVLGARPHATYEGRLSYELFGDYDLENAQIRAWMRTAMQGRVTSHRGFLNTLLHELCHHLDVRAFGWPSSPHTRGFFARVDELYHLALATPPESRKTLVWIKRGSSYQIDWAKLRAKGQAPGS
jgi:hypothetical protein